MTTPSLAELTAFAAVAERRSFSRAAVALGVSASALSHSVRELEARLGVRLLNRTTRSVAPTEAGARLLERLRPALGAIGEALDEVNEYRGRPKGTLRLNVPRSARFLLQPVIARFLSENPDMRLEIECDDRLIDIVAEGFDAGVRFGEQIAADMIAVRLGGPVSFVLLASPAYLAEHGRPEHPDDLARHRCIRRRFSDGSFYRWELEGEGRELEVEVDGRFTTNDEGLALDAAADGVGIALSFDAMAEPWIASGRLVRVLEDWCPPFPGPYLYYPSRRHMSAGLRAFIDLATAR
jgi:DNA-binding transcriptional LysR family regulator